MVISDTEKNLIKKLTIIFIGFFLIELVLGGLILYVAAMKQTNQYLESTSIRIKDDISYQKGKWDIYRYNADPKLPDTYPLYVLSADGYVIDRWKPVHGFLDVSDFQHLVSYQIPQTVTTPTNQSWRMYAKIIQNGNQQLGVITVAKYNPDPNEAATTDKQLLDTANAIYSKITIQGSAINTNSIDARDIPYNISFQVVNKYNIILAKNNNTNSIDQLPNYIDSSYIGNALNTSPSQIITDSTTHEPFLIFSTPILDQNHTVVGIIVIGRSIQSIYDILINYIIAQLVTAFIVSIILGFFIHYLVKMFLNDLPKHEAAPEVKQGVTQIKFDKKQSVLYIDKDEISIPYATNQYYMCEALFSHPKKRWNIDELLERFGENIDESTNSWRKVYDSMLIINKKVAHIVDIKLIVLRDKTYLINPDLASKIM